MASFISSMLSARLGFGKMPTNCEMSRFAGISRTRPSDSMTNRTRSPDFRPRNSRTSLGTVIWPLLVTVASLTGLTRISIPYLV